MSDATERDLDVGEPPLRQKVLWLQCTQCGWGEDVTRKDEEDGRGRDGQSCPHCGIGPIRLDEL